jgi:hypothetical protein
MDKLLNQYKDAIKQITSLTSQLTKANAKIEALEAQLFEEIEDWGITPTSKQVGHTINRAQSPTE